MNSVTINDLARQHRLHPGTARQYLKKLGVSFHYVRVPERGNQACAAITNQQAREFNQWRVDRGFTGLPIDSWQRRTS